jgi:hypothetical protein
MIYQLALIEAVSSCPEASGPKGEGDIAESRNMVDK